MARKQITTADGRKATRVTGHDGNTWLVAGERQSFIVEIPAGADIAAYDGNLRQESYAPARAWRLYADEIDPENRGHIKPGWYVEASSYGAIGPFSNRREAENELRRYAREEMGQYFRPGKPQVTETAEPQQLVVALPTVEIEPRTLRAPYTPGNYAGRWASVRRIGRLLIETDILPDRILVHSRVIGTGDYLPVRSFPRNPEVVAAEAWTTDGHWPIRVNERLEELRAQWSRIWLVTEYVNKADTAEYRATRAAAHDASYEMARRGLWRSSIGPSSTDPTWETWYEIALDLYDRELIHLQRQEA